MFGKLKSAAEVLREAWLARRAPPNPKVFEAIHALAELSAPRGLGAYLADRPALGRQEVVRDWARDAATGEMRLAYTSSWFADGCLRIRPGRGNGTLVFLPGNLTAADEVLAPGRHARSMTGVADELGMALASWDWPLQGARLDGCLYLGLRSLYSAEREYSRFLPALGTSLWREFVAELQFALLNIRRCIGDAEPMHVAGWSMGGCFAYLAPLLCGSVGTTLAMGSCARMRDLIAEGATRRHGFFFYPVDALSHFDLDTLVDEVLASKHPLGIIHGDLDEGCLASTRDALAPRARSSEGLLAIEVLPGHGHTLSPAVKARIVALLGPGEPGPR